MRRLLVITQGDTAHGMGHVVRQCVLARALAQYGIEVLFRTPRYTPGGEWIMRAGFQLLDPGEFKQPIDGVLVDLEHGPTRNGLELAHDLYPRVIVVAGNGYTLQDYAAVRELADLEIYQGLDAMPGDKAISGPEHILIDPAYRDCVPDPAGHVVVSLGGADPHHLTAPVLVALAGLDRPVRAIIGPAAQFTPPTALPAQIEYICAPPSLVPHLNGAALLVGAFGTVAWEALAAGVPCVLTNWSENHAETAKRLKERGVAANLGLWSDFRATSCALVVNLMVGARDLWAESSRLGRQLVDGQGAGRCAARIAEMLR